MNGKPDPTRVNHPVLGRIRGLLSGDGTTIQFRNIKYGTIAERWGDPIMFNRKLSGTEFDASEFGPICPQAHNAVNTDLALLGNISLPDEEMTESEFDCLNLVITVPVLRSMPKGLLPVIVWSVYQREWLVCENANHQAYRIHGGGLSIGSNSFPQYDLTNFASKSAELDLPVITVSINYRLGIFGFLASEELGISGNYGLKDQMCAFKWLRGNISGFGGNHENITAFGESAGAISLSALLVADQPLFLRAILMSGELTLRNIRGKAWHNSHYQKNVQLLGLENLPTDERIQKLYSMGTEELVQRLPVFQHWSPSVDGVLLVKEVDLGMLSDGEDSTGKPAWCEAIVIGDMKHDGTVLNSRFTENPDALYRLQESVDILLTPSETQNLLNEYKINLSHTVESNKMGLLELITDLRFYLATLQTQQGWIERGFKNVNRYHIHQLNSLDGPMLNLASHEFDVALLFKNFDKNLPPNVTTLGTNMIELWSKFAYDSAWPRYEAGGVLQIGPDERIVLRNKTEFDLLFRNGRGKLLQEIGWKKSFQLGEMLQGCYY